MDLGALESLGFRQFFRAQLGDLPDGCSVHRVSSTVHGFCELLTTSEGGSEIARARVDSKLARAATNALDLPAAGDFVGVTTASDSCAASDAEPRVTFVFERATRLVRKAAGDKTEPQVIASNVDLVGVMLALTEDDQLTKRARRAANPRRLERYLLAVEQSGARPVVLLNKADRSPNPEAALAPLREVAGDAPLLVVSALEGTGIDELEAMLGPGDTFALVGMSGVGKSTLLSRLAGVTSATSEARGDDERGRHTTTRRELHLAPSGVLILDTPGMRELALWAEGDTEEEADNVFEDIAELAQSCRFRDCKHEGEPGCAVTAAVDSGDLSQGRLSSYFRLKKELYAGTAAQKQAKRQWEKSVAQFVRKQKNPKR